MAKIKKLFVCQSCGGSFPTWSGQCSACGEWNTLVEEIAETNKSGGVGRAKAHGGKRVSLKEAIKKKHTKKKRLVTHSQELDRVLGGGIVPGSVVLVGGEPGIGKSTLLTQLAMGVGSEGDQSVLYVCGEESVDQVGLRVRRLSTAKGEKNIISDVDLMAEMDVDVVVATIEEMEPDLVIVDSIQTMSTSDLTGMSGSVGQVRESAMRLIRVAKRTGSSVFLVGHVTKEGSIAGPKVLEHMVDAVLSISGEKTGLWRIMRSYKNRFGAVDEVGVFSMTEAGMVDVANPSGAFLEERQAGRPGSAVVVLMEGTRPVLVEVQALVVKSTLAMPRRVAQGMPLSKLQVLAAVLQKHARLKLGEMDVFVNVVGGLKLTEPAADLGVAMAIASSVKNVAVPEGMAVVGEVGLLGEIRSVPFLDARIKEAKKLGYTTVLSPKLVTSVGKAVGRLR